MNKKLNTYHLIGSIHTISFKTLGLVDVPEAYKDTLVCSSRKSDGEIVTTCKLNLDKISTDIYSFKEYRRCWTEVLDSLGIENPKLVRADFRLDSSDPEHYERFAKLNRYLISMFAVTYRVQNIYKSVNLFTEKQLSVAIKSSYIELENYDKAAESRGRDKAYSRFELRSKRMSGTDLKNEFTEHWFKRFDKAIQNIPKVQQEYNTALIQKYNSGKNAFPVEFRSLTDFLIQYKNCIFSKNQLIELLSKFPEVKDASIRATNFKKKYGADFYTSNQIQAAINEIKRAIKAYFEN